MVNFVTVKINKEKCDKCFDCVKCCPNKALTLEKGIFMHNSYGCAYCMVCSDVCPNKAITILEM